MTLIQGLFLGGITPFEAFNGRKNNISTAIAPDLPELENESLFFYEEEEEASFIVRVYNRYQRYDKMIDI